MVKSFVTLAVAALAALPATVLAAPTSALAHLDAMPIPGIVKYIQENHPDRWAPACNNHTMRVRKDFDTLPPEERKNYTNAVNCLRSMPSQLDPNVYPAATNRFMDYAIVHVNRTKVAHLSGFFLTWHRYFLHLYEEDLRNNCGFTGHFPYWNWPATASNLTGSNIFNGDEYSMSGDGAFTNNDPIVLAPGFSLPHGSGGGCIKSGPFQGMNVTLNDIPISIILQGLPIPANAYEKNETCLTRDLNEFAATTWCNSTDLTLALEADTVGNFTDQVNGILGGTQLGLHSGAHFIMGAPASSLFVSPQDPIWYPLHTMLDNVYTQWQARHPNLALSTFGTETAANLPPSPNVTLSTIHPTWGYFSEAQISVGELMSTTSGPFCYRYENNF